MTGRVPRGTEEHPPGEADAKAAATSTAIAGLRRRLKRDGIGDPSVRKELRKLEELLIGLFDQAGRQGRHRSQASKAAVRRSGQDTGDTDAPDLKPEPDQAITAADSASLPRQPEPPQLSPAPVLQLVSVSHNQLSDIS